MTSSWRRFAPIDGVVVVLAQRARLAHNNNNINEMARMTNPNKTIANMQETTITTMYLGVCVCVCLCFVCVRTMFCLLLGHTAFNTSAYACVCVLCVSMYVRLCALLLHSRCWIFTFRAFSMHFIEFYTFCIICINCFVSCFFLFCNFTSAKLIFFF